MSSLFLRVPDLSSAASAAPPLPTDAAISYNFPLDPFQLHAIKAIHDGENVLVTAKTGSGKTLVAEYAIAYALRQGQRIFYTTPIKSLSNQKYHDLKHLFPAASVGILTGDIKCNPDAQIVVMTTEILRNLLFKHATPTAHLGTAGTITMDSLGTVVFDEVHYINDPDRGHVWEESLVLMPPHIRLILLSATIDSPAAFAGWLGNIKQVPCHLLATTHRVVPLEHAIYTPQLHGPPLILKTRDEDPTNIEMYREWLKEREATKDAQKAWRDTVKAAQKAGDSMAGSKNKVRTYSFQHTLNDAVATFQARELLPALFFAFSRAKCEEYAAHTTGTLLTSCEVADVKHIISFHLHRYDAVLQHLPQFHQVRDLLMRGVAFHHSGLHPLLKEITEILFVRGFVRVLFATETFAIGLNMPTRTVVFTALEKPSGDPCGGLRLLRYDEYTQMAGRAGRRGKDKKGFVFYMPAKEPVSAEELRSVMSGSLVPLESHIRFHYDFVLKAIWTGAAGATGGSSPVEGDALPTQYATTALLTNSYWAVQRREAIEGLVSEIQTAKQALSTLSTRLTSEQREAFAAKADIEHKVRTLTNAKQKTAKLALRRWEEDHDSPAWTNATRTWTSLIAKQSEVAHLESQHAEATGFKPEDRLEPVLAALAEWGYITDDGTPALTQKGILATEVNEGNPFLMTELYLSGALKHASAREIIATLAAFVSDHDTHKKGGDLECSYVLPTVAHMLEGLAEKGRRLDFKHGITSPSEFWELGPYWSAIVGDWLSEGPAAEAAAITVRYEIYAGNLMRGLLKVANLVNEWIAIATFCADVEMLDRMRDAQQSLLRDFATPDSLYLRL